MLQPLQDCGPLRKFDEGLGATLSQMYSSSVAQSATPSSSSSPNGTKGVSSSSSAVVAPGQARPSGGQVGGSNNSNNNSSGGGGGSSSSTIQSSANFPTSGGGGGNNNNNNNSSSDVTPVFNLATGRRESPLDLSVKTVRQSADSSTSSLAVIDGQGGGGSNGSSTTSNGGAANRSHSSSGSSTPNLSSINTNHLHSATIPASSTNIGTVIAAVANSTTSSPKEPGGHGAGLSSGESKSGASSTSSSSASGGNNPVSSGTADRSSSKSRKNLIPSNVPNNSNCNSTTNSGNSGNPEVSVNPAHHHLFGGHPSHGMHPPVSQHPVHGLHGGSSSVRSVAHPFAGQNAAAPHAAAPQPLPSAPPPPFSSGDHHHHHLQQQQQQSTPQQPTQQPPRPSSAIPSYNPGHLGNAMPTYHHQYHQGQGQPAPHHTAYHHSGYPQYHPHFPAQSPVGHHPPPAPPPGPGQHLNYYSSYGHSHPSHTPVSAPPPSQAVQNSSNSSTTPRDSTPQTVGAGGNPSAGPPLHSQMNYPTPKSMPAPLGSHYPTASTPGPQSFAAAFAHGLSANGHPPHAQPPYYATSSAAPSIPRPSPQDAQNPGQHPATHYTVAGHHIPQYVHPYGHYAGQSPYANYHHHHQQQQPSLQPPPPPGPGSGQSSGKANPSYPSSVVGSSAGMAAMSRQGIPGRPHPGVGNVIPSYPSTPNNVGSADPHRPHISNHLHHPPPPPPQQQQQHQQQQHQQQPQQQQQQLPHQQPSAAPNNTSLQPSQQAVTNVPGPAQSKAAKGGQPRASFGGREGKTSSRKNLLSLLRNSCENRIHEKQEKEKFQFNHQTWNFHGRKFNTVLPPLTSSNSSASSASNVNQNSNAGSVGTDSNNIPSANSSGGGGRHVATPTSVHVPNGSNNGSPNSTKQKMLDPYSSSSSALTSLQMKSEKGSPQLLSDGSSAANSYHSITALNRIRTKAEKKQLFPNLLSQIEQENSSRVLGQGATPSLPSSSSFAATDSEGRNHFHSHSSKPPTSVFDFEDDDDVGGSSKGAVNSIKTVKKSPAKRLSTGSNKREKDSHAALLPETAKAAAASSSEINSVVKAAATVEIPTAVGGASNSAVNPTVLKSEQQQQDNGDSFWAACDSFLSDLASNPQTIKSRRGGLWQKLKGKSSASANNSKSPSANAKVKRTLKNSSEEDSDFKVEEDEDDDDKSEEEEEEEDDDDDEEEDEEGSSSVRENGVVDSVSEEASENKSVASESNKVSVLKRKTLRDSSLSSQRKRRKLSPESVKKSSLRSSTTKNNNNSSVCKNKTRASLASNKKAARSSRRTSSPEISSRNRRRRQSARRGTRGRIVSDEDDDNGGTSSIGSESEDENSEEDSDSSQSFSVNSYSDSVENYDSSSDDDSDDSDSDSEDSEDDDDEFDLDSNSLSSGAVRKSRRRLRNSKENAKSSSKKKSLRSSSKSMSLRRKSNRSSSKKNKKSSKKKNKKDSKRGRSQRRLRNSVKTRSLRKSRPKRNCAPVAGKGRLKDISGESDDEERQDGSSGEEWIMRRELGKKKRRIVFGDGSDFRRPGWEEELIDFKKKLRMPSKLIRVAKPSSMSALGGSRGENSSSSSIKDNNETEKDVKDVVTAKDSSSNNKENSDKESGTKKPKTRPSKTGQKSEDKTTKIANTATNAASPTASSPAKSLASKGKGKTTKDEEKSSLEKDDKEKAKEGKKATTGKEEKIRTPNKKAGKKEVVEKAGEEADALCNNTNSGKKDEDRYTKLAKEKEAQMLPTPGAAGNKFNKKMSIKSVFGVDLPSSANTTAAEVSSNSSTTAVVASTPAVSTTDTATTTAAATLDKPAPVKKTLRRNKFKSGFDYIRKKKRVIATPDGVEKPPASKRIKTNENKVLKVEDVQVEVRSWVLNKGLGETVLHRAARLGYPDIASYCLEHDMCSPNSKDNAGYSPLHETCIKGHLEVAKVLLAYGANPSQAAPGGIRPLHEACENGHVELVRLLVAYGADPLLATYAGQSPLELAEPHKEVRQLLEEHIMDVQGKQNKPWVFRGSGKWAEEKFDCGFQVTDAAPSPEEPADPDAFEFEASENALPPLYRLKGETSFYVLLQDLLNYIGQPKDRFLKSNPSADMVELNSNDFLEQAHCCHLLGERFNLNSSSDLLTLIKYDDRVKKMLNIESVFIK